MGQVTPDPGRSEGDEDVAGVVVAALQVARSLEYEEAPAYLSAAESAAAMVNEHGATAVLKSRVLCELGNARRVSGEFTGATEAIDQAISLAESLPDGATRHELLALGHLRLAIVCDVIDSIVAGFEHLDTAGTHFRATGDEDGLAKSDMVRGALHLRIDDFAQSEESYLRALAFYRRTGQPDRTGSVLSNLSVLYRFMGRHDEAVAAGREAVSVAESLLLRTASSGNLAFALGEAGQLEEALELVRQTTAKLAELGDPNYIIEYKRALAWVLSHEGESEEARDLLLEALSLAEERGYQRDVTSCHGLLADVYRDLGDFRSAYGHLEAYHRQMLAQSRKKAASQLEVHRWRLELDHARVQAEHERARRRSLARSLEELSDLHEKLNARAVELEWSSYRDALTELANRRYFDERLARETDWSLETGNAVALLMVDLDDFKSLNDRFGHPAGDDVLRTTARILEATAARRADVTARIGGEEFAVLLTRDVTENELKRMAEQLRRAIAEHDWSTVAPDMQVTASIGAASLAEAEHDPVALLKLADQRLYAAKRSGRNRVVTGVQGTRQVR